MSDFIYTIDSGDEKISTNDEEMLELNNDNAFQFTDQTSKDVFNKKKLLAGTSLQNQWDFKKGFVQDEKKKDQYFTSIKEKVQKLMKENNIEELVPEELMQKNKEKTIKKEENKIIKKDNVNKAKIFYENNEKLSFTELCLSKPLIKACNQMLYDHPTPIQKKTIPLLLEGHDILASAVTGSGKTACFLLPILEKLLRRSNKVQFNMTSVLILTPARELASQCYSMLQKLSVYTKIQSSLVIGGSSTKVQLHELQNKPDIIVATPGRLIDHLRNSRSVELDNLSILVLDEADKLLEMGFKDEINEILKKCNSERQTLMFSATLSSAINELANIALKNPIKIDENSRQISIAPKIAQYVVRIQESEDDELSIRRAILLTLAMKYYNKRTIIFLNNKKECHKMMIIFYFFNLSAAHVNGDLDQKERLEAIEKFQNGDVDFLLATDLLARGLDIYQVDAVINFEFPKESKRYIHRIGRTARAGSKGTAITICNDDERTLLKKLGRKSGYNVNTFSINKNYVNSLIERIKKVDELAEKIIIEEKEEKEIYYAMKDAERAQNLIEFSEEIKNRPKKTWFLNEKGKQNVKKRDNENMKKLGENEKKGMMNNKRKVNQVKKGRMEEIRSQKIAKKIKLKRKKTDKIIKENKSEGETVFGVDKELRKNKLLKKRKAHKNQLK